MTMTARFFSTAALVASLLATQAPAENNYAIAVPPELTSKQRKVLKTKLEELFLGLGPKGALALYDGSAAEKVAHINIPDAEKFARRRAKMHAFRGEIGKMMDFLDQPAPEGGGETNIQAFTQYFGEHQAGSDIIELMILGGGVFTDPSDEGASVRIEEGGALIVPNERLIKGTLAESGWGTAGREQALSGAMVHMCMPYGDLRLSTYQISELHRAWGLYLKAQGAALISFSHDLPACLERFAARERNVRTTFDFTGDANGPRAMLRIRREPLEVQEVVWPHDEVDKFSQFDESDHPYMRFVKVVTGIEYTRDSWPSMSHSWCYTQFTKSGVKVKIDLGSRSPLKDVVWHDISKAELEAAGISRADAEAGRSACQFPGDPA